jgi:hypothetical protein
MVGSKNNSLPLPSLQMGVSLLCMHELLQWISGLGCSWPCADMAEILNGATRCCRGTVQCSLEICRSPAGLPGRRPKAVYCQHGTRLLPGCSHPAGHTAGISDT